MSANSPGAILVADDEDSVRFVLVKALESAGHSVTQARGGREALDHLRERPFDLAFVDLRMPDYDGLAVLASARESGVQTPIVIVTAQNTMDNAIEAMKRGAYDYIAKPFNIDEVQAVAGRALEMARLSTDLKRVERELRGRFEVGVAIVGNSPAMQEIYKIIGRIANTDTTVLIQGESGTGKELIAKVIHYHSPRWSGPFVAINCSAIPRELLESELFGHEKGAFTGALARRPGRFELADGGTLFLDEVGDLPAEVQVKLLRVLQERTFERVGGTETLKTDVRVISATHRDLEKAISENEFREDLYYRLAVLLVHLPPLRDRKEDIPLLVKRFLGDLQKEAQGRLRISPDAMERLVAYGWPGNVRELQNEIRRAAVLCDGIILETHLSTHVREGRSGPGTPMADDGLAPSERGTTLPDMVRDLEIREIQKAFDRAQSNKSRAADLLGLSRFALQRKLEKYALDQNGRPTGLPPAAGDDTA